jgi:thiamine kinase-like enzyme
MNIIHQLFDEQFVTELFKVKVLPLYPDFVDVKKIIIKPHKHHIWEKTYHVVIEFKTTFITKEGKIKKLPIFASAHSDEPRKNVYDGLKFLWEHSFSRSYLTIPHPLFYSKEFRATFYRGAKGRNLYRFIREKNFSEIEAIVPKAAEWFAKLHKIPTKNARNFNEENSRIETVVPGVKHILDRIIHDYPKYHEAYKQTYEIVINNEKQFLSQNPQRWLVHGDAHPENIIEMSESKIAVIDFTDLCLSDFTRDIGCLIQQVEFMCNRKISDPKYSLKIKEIFLDNYLKNAKIKLDEDLQKRIDNYYNWTAIRTATFFLLKDKAEPERAKPIISQVLKNLNIY